MHDYEKQFDQLIENGRVWYYREAPLTEYFLFLFSIADFVIGRGTGGDDFRTWYRWNYRKGTKQCAPSGEVERAFYRASGEVAALWSMGLMVRLKKDEKWSEWASELPKPEALRRVLLTLEEVEAENERFRKSTLGSIHSCIFTPEEMKKQEEEAYVKLSSEVIRALKRGYQLADERERLREQTPPAGV